ncbi:MAG: hypothetical protein HQL02_12860, partial [Nitrospirae bacterium]|nr:hypothetical protein [Nitrospirota bacterium]
MFGKFVTKQCLRRNDNRKTRYLPSQDAPGVRTLLTLALIAVLGVLGSTTNNRGHAATAIVWFC